MKKYNRETKKWEDEKEIEKKLKKRDTCKGGREHDWLEMLPWGIEALPNYKGLPEPYYDTEKAIAEFSEKKYKELENIGIRVNRYNSFKNVSYRHYLCSVCNKKMYQYKK